MDFSTVSNLGIKCNKGDSQIQFCIYGYSVSYRTTDTYTHTHTFIKQELTCRKALLHSLYRLMRQRKEKWLAHDYSTVCVCVRVCLAWWGDWKRGEKQSVRTPKGISFHIFPQEHIFMTHNFATEKNSLLCVCPLWICLCVHTHICTHTVNASRGGGCQERKDRRHPDSTDRGEKRQRGHLSLLWIPQVASEQEVGTRPSNWS